MSYNQDADHKIGPRCRILIRVLIRVSCVPTVGSVTLGVVWILCAWERQMQRNRKWRQRKGKTLRGLEKDGWNGFVALPSGLFEKFQALRECLLVQIFAD